MPRQRGRPTAAPRKPATPTAQQTRPATTAAYPPKPAAATAAPPAAGQQQASSSPGILGQVASTAAGVAIGSSIGHAIGGFFGGGSSAPEAAQDNGAVASESQNTNQFGEQRCDLQIQNFNKCMDEQQGNMSICNWYLEQLKACQTAAKPY
ncbi:CHCH domain-containing protein [Rutstroemia sp. NJR-2017a WRK4]|nr:CHCH domain-containing protein [Rutstroemia sp. NJR-2017a BBW]PQE13443.1 CHCH domain-containing protein [Rutstroemia sp. NJR-2017a WRK4]